MSVNPSKKLLESLRLLGAQGYNYKKVRDFVKMNNLYTKEDFIKMVNSCKILPASEYIGTCVIDIDELIAKIKKEM